MNQYKKWLMTAVLAVLAALILEAAIVVYVDPFFQGGGIGKALMEYFLEEARECGCRSIYLWVLEKNSRARGIYESYGFVFDGTRQIEEGTPEYLRRYVLQNP